MVLNFNFILSATNNAARLILSPGAPTEMKLTIGVTTGEVPSLLGGYLEQK